MAVVHVRLRQKFVRCWQELNKQTVSNSTAVKSDGKTKEGAQDRLEVQFVQDQKNYATSFISLRSTYIAGTD